MQKRKLGPFSVSALGLGCMTLSHAYGTPPDPATAATVLNSRYKVETVFRPLPTHGVYLRASNSRYKVEPP